MCFLDAEAARARAAAGRRRGRRGDDPGPFAGVPMGVKELAQVAGLARHERVGAVRRRGRVAEFDCAEVARLRDAGAVLVGLTTAPEHGVVSYTVSKLHGVTRNPWNLERTPGGSSGGSAASVAAGLFPVCTGSDGGGSIRIPSSYSGLFGMKTTFGLLGAGPSRSTTR